MTNEEGVHTVRVEEKRLLLIINLHNNNIFSISSNKFKDVYLNVLKHHLFVEYEQIQLIKY